MVTAILGQILQQNEKNLAAQMIKANHFPSIVAEHRGKNQTNKKTKQNFSIVQRC